MSSNRIEQEFIINASQALQELVRLDKGLQTFEARIDAVAKSIGNLNSIGGGGLAAFKTNAQGAAAAVGTLNSSLVATNTTGSRAIVTFATLSRVVQTQLTIGALNGFRQAITDSVSEAAALQKQFALISTIAQRIDLPGTDTPVDTSQISSASRGLSDSLNIDQLEVAKGLYNAISNQVGTFAESLTFAAEAGKFAKATNSQLTESVDSLSAVLKSYNLGADQTARVSDILFATIDKGRVTASELGNSLGRVLPAASELGISFEEVGAAIAAVSVKGLSTDETLTQVRATMTGLIKPSDAMKLAFEGLGISSAKAGIQQFGLVGLLEKLRNAYGQNEQALGKLFPNVRNIGAVFALTGTNLDDYNKTLDAVTNSQGKANEAFAKATNTGSEKLAKAYNQVKNSLAGVASGYIDATAATLESTGLLNIQASSVSDLANVLKGGALAYAAFTFATVASTTTLGTFSGAVTVASTRVATLNAFIKANPIGLIAAGIALAAVGINAFNTSKLESIKNGFKELNDADLSKITKQAKELGEQGADALGRFNETVRGGRLSIEEAVRAVGAGIRTLGQDDAVFTGGVERSIDTFSSALDRRLSLLKSAASEAKSLAEQARGNIASIKDEQRDLKFDQATRGLSDRGKAGANLTRAAALAREAQEAFNSAAASGDSEGLARSKSLFDAAKASAANAASLGAQVQADKILNDLAAKRLSNEEALVRLGPIRAKQAQEAALKQQAINDAAKVDLKNLKDNSSTVDSNGQPLREEELAKRAAKLKESLDRLKQASGVDIDLSTILDAKSLRAVAQDQLSGLRADIEVSLKDGGANLIAQAEAIFAKFNEQQFVKDNKGPGEGNLRPEDLDRRVSDTQKLIPEIDKSNQTLVLGLKEREDAIAAAGKALAVISDHLGAKLTLQNSALADASDATGASDNAGFKAALEASVPQLKQILGDALSNPDIDVEGLKARFLAITERLAEAGKNANAIFSVEETGFAEYAKQVQILFDKSLLVKNAKLDASITPPSDNGPILTQTQYYNNLTNAARNAAAAKAAAAGAGGGVSGGDVQSFSHGGVARGVDTINARLRPGEAVLNPRATKNFFGSINALNAGQMPQQRGQSNVTNVGDVHVNVGGQGANSAANAREIALALRRELQRGTSRL